MTILIEKDVPRPSKKSRNGKYPFATMEIDNSFFVAGCTKKISTAPAAKKLGFKFESELQNGGCRVWRVA